MIVMIVMIVIYHYKSLSQYMSLLKIVICDDNDDKNQDILLGCITNFYHVHYQFSS